MNPLAIIRLLRPQQWVKNLLLAAPLFFTPSAVNGQNLMLIGLGILSFCGLSGAIYALNDVLDADRDRMHEEKRTRPVASGAVTPAQAVAVAILCGAGALGGAFALDFNFAVICIVYVALNIAYSFYLKNVAILDVMTIALSFLLRIYAGSELIGHPTGPWIQLCTGLLALFLALAKRRDDLAREMVAAHRPSLVGYNKSFLDSALTVVISGVLVSYVIYTTDREIAEKLGTARMYETVPFVVAGILRYLQLTLVHQRSGAPTTILLTDRASIAIVLGWIVVSAVLIYG